MVFTQYRYINCLCTVHMFIKEKVMLSSSFQRSGWIEVVLRNKYEEVRVSLWQRTLIKGVNQNIQRTMPKMRSVLIRTNMTNAEIHEKGNHGMNNSEKNSKLLYLTCSCAQ